MEWYIPRINLGTMFVLKNSILISGKGLDPFGLVLILKLESDLYS